MQIIHKMPRLIVEYTFKNDNAQTGYSKGRLDYPRNPNKHTAAEVERIMKAAEQKENKPVILVGFIEYGS